jgi:hypothetical protein
MAQFIWDGLNRLLTIIPPGNGPANRLIAIPAIIVLAISNEPGSLIRQVFGRFGGLLKPPFYPSFGLMVQKFLSLDPKISLIKYAQSGRKYKQQNGGFKIAGVHKVRVLFFN